MADVDEPDEPNISDQCDILTIPNEDNSEGSEGSDGSSVEIIDGGSDAEICEETELQRFSRILCEAQRKAQAQEKAKGNTRKTYQGLSRTTAYRRKRVRNDLAAQGFLSVPLYMARMESKNKEKLTFESEESSDNDEVFVSRLWSDKQSNSESDEERLQATHGPAACEGGRHWQVTQGPCHRHPRQSCRERSVDWGKFQNRSNCYCCVLP
jgi:hypothetical protein